MKHLNRSRPDERDRPLVLIVDGDGASRRLGKRTLETNGFSVFEIDHGLGAIEQSDIQKPDIVVLDTDTTRTDGFETCRRLRRNPVLRMTPIVMMTSSENRETIDHAFSAGATDFAVKPIDWVMLGHRIRYWLRSAETLAELAEAQRVANLGSWSWEAPEMSWSDQLFRILGLLPGRHPPTLDTLLATMSCNDRRLLESYLATSDPNCGEFSLIHPLHRADGQRRIVDHRVTVTPGTQDQGVHFAATIQDVTEREQAANQIKRLAYFDTLTDLPNRESFRLQLEKAVAAARRHERHAAVLYLDLDDFKKINETLGHSVGDQLLRVVSQRLHEGLRSEDIVSRSTHEVHRPARLGGDEFAVLLSEVKKPSDAALVAERLLESLSMPVRLGEHEVYVTPSIGIAVFPEDGETSETLLQHADVAMYQAKQAGKNLYRHFHPKMNEAAMRRLELDQHLRRALERDEFHLVYQPKIDSLRGRIDGAEALLRWESPELGPVSPLEFIPVAEANGLILSIGDWVLRNACEQARSWRDLDIGLPCISVNMSSLQFMQPNFVGRVRDLLERSGLEPRMLDLEITESLLASDADTAVEILAALKLLGVQLSIDDFGTGYSSLSYLKRFPIDRLKIDRSFIRDLGDNRDDGAIVSAILGLAAGMHLQVTAEGVETQAQAELLKSEGCHQLQGYLFSPPVKPGEFVSLIHRFGSLDQTRILRLHTYRSA